MKAFKLFLLLALAPLAAVTVAARAAADPEQEAADGSAMFDGASRYAAAVSPQATAQDKAELLAEFRKHVDMDDHGVPAERRAMDSMLARMMESPTAREIAAKFIKENARVKLSLGDISGSTIATVDGQKTVWGTRGYTMIDRVPPCVVMNKLYMQEDVEPGEGTLAHEMLGHAFEKYRAGELDDVYKYNTDEEENARLIGWLVATELKVKPADETWDYMENPDNNREYIKLMSPYYSLTLTSEEMKDPVPLYKKRMADADAALKKLPQTEKNRKDWAKIVDHFTGVHKMEPASFQTIQEGISNGLKYIPVSRDNLTKIKEALQERITFFSSEEGKALLKRLAKDADSEYFRQKDAVILERRQRLADLLIGKTKEDFNTPPAVGQVTWDQLSELWNGDKKSCASGVLK